MKTNAIVFTGVDRVEFREIDMPAPAAHEVQVRTAYSTISAGTEGWCLQDSFTWVATPYPCVPGYQRVGTITAVGSAVTDWKVGDRVMATIGSWPKGDAEPFWGAHIAVGNTPASEVYHMPPGTDEVDASAGVVAQVGYNAAYRATISPGDWVVVYGDGLIGQCGAQAARSRGARVVLAGHRDERLELAAMHSAEAVVNTRTEDVAQAVRKIIGAKTVPVLIDTVQTIEAQRQYIDLLENRTGQIVYSGFSPSDAWASMAMLQQRELTTHCISGWTRERMEATLTLMADGKMRVRPLVTHLVPAAEGPETYRMIRAKGRPFLGITLDWNGENV